MNSVISRVGYFRQFCGVSLGLLLLPLIGFCANIEVDSTPSAFGGAGTIYITGEISREDADKFRKAITRLPQPKSIFLAATVELHSDGGDVDAALQIGRIVRANSMKTKVPLVSLSVRDKMGKFPMGRCVSSCVFIFAGGVVRDASRESGVTPLGIHRPYDTETGVKPLTRADQQYKEIEATIKMYLREMNVSERLADEAFRIPPHRVKFLTEAEANDLALTGIDPAYEDMQASVAARNLGLSKTEYFNRRRRADHECGTFESILNEPNHRVKEEKGNVWGRCVMDIMEGRR